MGLFFTTFPSLGQQSAAFGLVYIGFVAWVYGTRMALIAFLVCTAVYSTKIQTPFEPGNMMGMILGVGIALSVGWVGRLYSKLKETEARLREEHDKSEMILGNIFPRRIVERLKNGEVTIADRYVDTTLLFSDLVGFTELTRFMSPPDLVKLLDDLITGFDQLSERLHKIEKIKTIGDAYLVVSGMPEENPHHATDICHMALAMLRFVEEFNQSHGLSLQIRIGINSGPVIGGVIGPKKFTFDLWGDTVNLASRLETTGLPGRIQVSQSTWELTRDHFRFESRQSIEIKGFGSMPTYFLLGPNDQVDA
jgi:adenylate cyclase